MALPFYLFNAYSGGDKYNVIYKKMNSNVPLFHATLKFLRNRLTDSDQILYTYSLETSKTGVLQLHFSEGARKP